MTFLTSNRNVIYFSATIYDNDGTQEIQSSFRGSVENSIFVSKLGKTDEGLDGIAIAQTWRGKLAGLQGFS